MLPAAGFVNGLALDRSGTLCVAALGQVRGGLEVASGSRHACGCWAARLGVLAGAAPMLMLAAPIECCPCLHVAPPLPHFPPVLSCPVHLPVAGAAPGALGPHCLGTQRAAGAPVDAGR